MGEMRRPSVPSKISSAVGNYLVPSLSFKRTIFMLLRLPDEFLIFRKTIPSLPVPFSSSSSFYGNLAKARVMSESVAELNHL
jgi:hypothetical protein